MRSKATTSSTTTNTTTRSYLGSSCVSVGTRSNRNRNRPSLSIRNRYLLSLGFPATPTIAANSANTMVPTRSTHAQAWNSNSNGQQVLPPLSSKINRKGQTTYTYNINSTNNDNSNEGKDKYNYNDRSRTHQQAQNENLKTRDINKAPDSPTCVSFVPEEESFESCDHLMTPLVPLIKDNQQQHPQNSQQTQAEEEEEERTEATISASETTNKASICTKKKTRSVSFDETVSVLTIPSKDAYSDRIRKYLWTEPHEMVQNTTRNAIEFASENWDWRQVAEDVEFFTCPKTGEKIHPCHGHTYSISYHYHQQHNHDHYCQQSASASSSSIRSPTNVSSSSRRPLNQHPFFEKSRQAAMAWQQCGGHM